jgi:multiple sugar transport system permease protein
MIKIMSKRKIMNFSWSFVRIVLLIGLAFIIVFPLIVKFSQSIKSVSDNLDSNVIFIPKNPTLKNYVIIMNSINYPVAFIYTVVFNTITSILQVFSCSLVAYGFARYKFPFKKFAFSMVILTMLIPPQSIMFPIWLRFKYFGFTNLFYFGKNLTGIVDMTDTVLPFLILSLTAIAFKNGLYIYLLRQYFTNIPKVLEEAAYIDGCGQIKTFFRIMLPSAIPMLVTVFLFSFVWQWNDRYYTGTLYPEIPTVANKLFNMKFEALQSMGDYLMQNLLSNAKLLLLIIPLLVLYIFTQNFFKESIARSGIVG